MKVLIFQQFEIHYKKKDLCGMLVCVCKVIKAIRYNVHKKRTNPSGFIVLKGEKKISLGLPLRIERTKGKQEVRNLLRFCNSEDQQHEVIPLRTKLWPQEQAKPPMVGLGLKVRETAGELTAHHKYGLLAQTTDGRTAWTDGERLVLHSGIMWPQTANGNCGSHRPRLFSAQNQKV